jgi:hypothetical protein
VRIGEVTWMGSLIIRLIQTSKPISSILVGKRKRWIGELGVALMEDSWFLGNLGEKSWGWIACLEIVYHINFIHILMSILLIPY